MRPDSLLTTSYRYFAAVAEAGSVRGAAGPGTPYGGSQGVAGSRGLHPPYDVLR